MPYVDKYKEFDGTVYDIAPADGTVKTSSLSSDFVLPIANGGTGAISASAARTGLGAMAATESSKFGKVTLTSINDGAVGIDNISLSSGVVTNLFTFTFEQGYLYICDFCVTYNANATGYRGLYLGTTAAQNGDIAAHRASSTAVNGAITVLHLPIIRRGDGATYYVNGFQSSGGALTAYPRYSYVRIPYL